MANQFEEIILAYWKAVNNRDWKTFEKLVSENIVYVLPQSRERVQGRKAFREFNETYPGEWTLSVVRLVVNEEGLGATQISFYSGGEEQTGISFFDIGGGLITRITEYWPSPYQPPARNSNFVESY